MRGSPSRDSVFVHAARKRGRLFEFESAEQATFVSGWDNSQVDLPKGHTHFGCVSSGQARLECESGIFQLKNEMYFVVPGAARIVGEGAGMVVSDPTSNGLFQVGGPLEICGRLRYIDGCSDTVLVSPPVLGDPCLNFLQIPVGTRQTEHTHPSLRVGVVISGSGVCRTPDAVIQLTPGLVFAIRPNGKHSFHTENDQLRIVAWHPDSDCGPSHEHHPMLNRTIVDGQIAEMKGRFE